MLLTRSNLRHGSCTRVTTTAKKGTGLAENVLKLHSGIDDNDNADSSLSSNNPGQLLWYAPRLLDPHQGLS